MEIDKAFLSTVQNDQQYPADAKDSPNACIPRAELIRLSFQFGPCRTSHLICSLTDLPLQLHVQLQPNPPQALAGTELNRHLFLQPPCIVHSALWPPRGGGVGAASQSDRICPWPADCPHCPLAGARICRTPPFVRPLQASSPVRSPGSPGSPRDALQAPSGLYAPPPGPVSPLPLAV